MILVLLLALLALPGTAVAQSLAGSWLYQGPNGAVRLSLEQSGTTLNGRMVGADGASFTLEGALEEGGATGSIRIGEGTGWFALGLVGQGLKLVVAEIDPATGQPDLSNGWELDFARDAASGPAPDPAGPPPAAGPAPALPSSGSAAGQSSPLVREWTGHLAGRKLSYRDSYVSDNASGFGGYSDRWDAWLCRDGTFLFQQRSRTTIDTGGAMGSSRSGGESRGTWQIVEHQGQAVLQYQMEGSAPDFGVLAFRDGATYLGSSRIFVTDDNPHCR